MPITPYFRPQDTITQILRQTPAQAVARRNPIVIGPQFRLFLDDGRDLHKVAFTGGAQNLRFSEADGSDLDLSEFAPDQASVKLMGEDLEAIVATAVDGVFAPSGPDNEFGVRIVSDLVAKTGSTGALNAIFLARNVQVGDVVRTTYNGATSVRRVVALLPKTTPVAPVVTRGTGDTAGVASITVNATAYNRSAVRTFRITINSDSGTVNATAVDVFGIEATTNITAEGTPVQLGTTGAYVTLPAGTYVAGHTYIVTLYPPTVSTTEFDGFRMDGPFRPATDVYDAGADVFTLQILAKYSGELTSGVTNYLSGNDVVGRTLAATATMPGAIYPFAANVGKVFLTYRAVVTPDALEGPISIMSVSDITENLGELSVDNWLGRAAFEAFNGNQKRRIYALRTAGDTVEAFQDALRKISTTDIYYALAPLTDSKEVMKLVADHCEVMSNKYNKNFRRCYLGFDTPGEYTAWGTLPDGSVRKADLVAGKITIADAYRADSVLTNDDVGSYTMFIGSGIKYKITQVDSAYECATDAPTGTTLGNADFALIRADNAINAVRAVRETAELIDNRRAALVWCDRPVYATKTSTQQIPSKFIAAEVAGLRCALLPQQGLTMTEIRSITAAPAMYTKYTPEQLDEAARYGVMVVTQESESGEIFIRHQLTTRTTDGALAYEDNVGVIVDAFSYDIKDSFRGYIGKRNVTKETIEAISLELTRIATEATKMDLATREAGPMIIRFFDEDGEEGKVTVRPDSVLTDSLLTYVKLRVPLPLNALNHYVDVETSVEL